MMREHGSSQDGAGKASITIEGTCEEIDAVRMMLQGAAWLRQDDGNAVQVPAYKPLPDPVDDPQIPPKWAVKVKVPPVGTATARDIEQAVRKQSEAVKPPYNVREEIEPGEGWHSPSFFVQHIGVGSGMADGYRVAAQPARA